jgi:poly(hydroxyalkanoate) depolymerase family esterase
LGFAGTVWSRVRDFFGRLFRRKKLPPPGTFVTGAKVSWRGFLATQPLIGPTRDYLAYVPHEIGSRWGWKRHPMLVLLHGCKQTPEDIAGATRIAAIADGEDLLVLLPRQNPRANVWGCWNWFDPATARGWGETAIAAAQIRAVRRSYRVDKRRVFVAGLSSGGALAAALAIRRPDLVAGVFVHSGIACGAASTPVAALGVGKNGANTDVVRIGEQARARADPSVLPLPLVVVQGGADDVVAPINAVQLVRQFLALNGHAAARSGVANELPPADRRTEATAGGRTVTTSDWQIGERLVVRHVFVDALGHAWSGGDPAYAWSDAAEPAASLLLAQFVRGDRR